MSKLTVTLETVTPLFMGGANQQAELRPAEFRGALRFWWRALWGGTHGDNWQDMRKAEAQIFGDTTQASPIVIRLKPLEISPPKPLEFSLDSGKGYLLWTTSRRDSEREAYPAQKAKFQIEISLRPGSTALHAFNETAAALWLLINLGGIGTRARRGLGSLTVTQEPVGWPVNFPQLYSVFGTPNELANYIETGIRGLCKALNWQMLVSLNTPTDFDILNYDTSKVYVLRSPLWPNCDSTLNGIGDLLRSFRGSKPPDHDGVLAVIKGQGRPKTVTRAAFGLPMQFYYRAYHEQCTREEQVRSGTYWKEAQGKTRFKATADVTVGGKEKGADRRASPLLFKVAPIAGGQFTVVIVFFESRLLKDEQRILIKPRDRNVKPVLVRAPDYDVIKEFLSGLPLIPALGVNNE